MSSAPLHKSRTTAIIASLAVGVAAVAGAAYLLWGSAEAPVEELTAVPPPPQEEELTAPQRVQALQLASNFKTKGNQKVQTREFDAALEEYEKCLHVLSYLGDDKEAEEQQQVVRSNAVLCFYKLERFEEACAVATEVLVSETLPPHLMAKVLYRRGLASKSLGETSAAVQDFQASIHFSPNQKNPEAERELHSLIG